MNLLLHVLLSQVPKQQPVALITCPEDTKHYEEARQCVEELALYLKPLSSGRGNTHYITHLCMVRVSQCYGHNQNRLHIFSCV